MKITLRQLKKLIEGVMTDDPEFPEKTDLTPAVKTGALSYDFKKLQQGIEDKYEKAAEFEPKAQAEEVKQFYEMLVNPNVDPEEFVFAIHGQPKYISQFFDLSAGKIELKGARSLGITKDREERIIEIMRLYHDESDPTLGKVLQREKLQKDFFPQGMEAVEAKIRGLFNTNELRVLDTRLRPLVEGQLVIYDYNYSLDQVVIELPREDYDATFVSATPEGDSIIDLGGIHYLWYLANRKTLLNSLYAQGYDDYGIFDYLMSNVPSSEMGSNHFEWSPKVGLYCALYAYIITVGLEWLGATRIDEDTFTVYTYRGNKILPALAELAAVKKGGIIIDDFPNFKSAQDIITVEVE